MFTHHYLYAVILILIGSSLSLEEPGTSDDLESAKTFPEKSPDDFQVTVESESVKQYEDEAQPQLVSEAAPTPEEAPESESNENIEENKEENGDQLSNENTENDKVNPVEGESPKDSANAESVTIGVIVDSNDQSEDNSSITTKWPCATFNITHVDGQPMVLALSNDEKVLSVFRVMNESSGCALVLFYSPYCEFSMKMAPLYNMLGRIYNDLAFMAIDAQESMSMAARYGIVGIPTVVLFYSGRAVARYNRSRTVEDFHAFIKDYTGFEPTLPLEIMPDDHLGPLPTKVIERTTLHLSIAMGFLMTFIIYHLFGRLIWALLCSLGSEVKSFFVHEKEE